ncbi:MAG: peptidase M48 [Gemmatimonadota bacterium]|nr:MAG: peptidase M48 [Gemmatimonadota bacterium]
MVSKLFQRLGATVALIPFAGSAWALPPGSTPRELELGQEAAADIAKAVELVDDEEQVAKLQAMLDEIAAATDRPEIEYRAHIVDTPAVNAFVIPGGWVYVTTGLLEAVESDDELAGVLGHEIAHNVNQHAIQRMRDAPRGLGLLQLAALAAMIIGRSPELGLVANAAANTITAMVLKGGSIAAEVEADEDGIEYLSRTRFNATGALTFHERMAIGVGRAYEEDLGIYQTHPFGRDRVMAARAKLKELGIPVHRRLVTRAPVPTARDLVRDDGPATEISYQGERLLLLAGNDPARSAALIESIVYTLDHEVELADIRIIPAQAGVLFAPGDGPRFLFSEEDGVANGNGVVLTADRLRQKLGGLLADEQARIQANTILY